MPPPTIDDQARHGIQRSAFQRQLERPAWQSPTAERVHVPRERLDVLDRRRRQDAVAEIEDVAGPSAGAAQHVVGRGEQAIERAEQQRRIEVALDARGRGRSRAQASSSGIRQSTPMTSPPASRSSARIAAVPTPKWIVGTPSPRARRRCAACAAARTRGSRRAFERADPRVEHLHGLDAGFDLRGEVVADHRRRTVRRGDATPRAAPYISALVCA